MTSYLISEEERLVRKKEEKMWGDWQVKSLNEFRKLKVRKKG